MLEEMLDAVIYAKNDKELEHAYRVLEHYGMDRYTATLLAAELKNERASIVKVGK